MFRYGSDEFLVFLACPDTSRVALLFERLCKKVADLNLKYADHEDSVLTLSIGVAMNEPRQDVEKLIQIADQALYKTKLAGRGAVAIN